MADEETNLEDSVEEESIPCKNNLAYLSPYTAVGIGIVFSFFGFYAAGHGAGVLVGEERCLESRWRNEDRKEEERLSLYKKALECADKDKDGELDYNEQIDLLKRLGHLKKRVLIECKHRHEGFQLPEMTSQNLEKALKSYEKENWDRYQSFLKQNPQ